MSSDGENPAPGYELFSRAGWFYFWWFKSVPSDGETPHPEKEVFHVTEKTLHAVRKCSQGSVGFIFGGLEVFHLTEKNL